MPIPKLTRRSYGFNENPDSRPARTYGLVEKSDRPEYIPKQKPKRPWWQKFFLGLYKMVRWSLSQIWNLVSLLWKRRPKLNNKQKKEVRKKILFISVIVIVLGFLSSTILVAWVSKDLPDPDRLTDRKVAQSTKIYDRTGEFLLYEIFADEKRTLVDLDQIPQNLIDGVVATEDTKFYEHRGVRPLSILRAFVYGIFSKERIGGTSTLTQQLVKNAILSNERSYVRKLKEIILSIRLEQKYTKEQILKIYFNEIPYGSTNYGAEAAAQSYFGKHVSELDLQESATLAGLPQAPTSFLNNVEALKERRNFVLRRMYEEGYITEEEKTSAQSSELTLSRHFGDIKAPHFVLYVKEQLVKEFGEQVVDSGGLKVITTLDWDKQQIAERVIDEKGSEVLESAGADNTSLVAIDPRSGEILAMVGSKDFYNEDIDGQFNVATLGKRQPGSSFKPIVYAAAFEKGYTAETVLFDVVTNFGLSSNNYKPLNYDYSEHGPVTMRQALQGSLNIPAVKTLYLVGDKKGVEFATRLGYSTLGEGDFGLSLVLGGGEVKLLDHVNAFAVFANNGTLFEPSSILKIEDQNSDILFELKNNKGKKVLDSSVTSLMSNILSDDVARAYAFGTGSILTLPGRPVAAKTGTTNSYVDGWTIGYTPSLVAGVWAGNTDNTPMKAGFGGSRVAGPIWNAFMKEALADTPVESFPSAPENTAKKAALRGSTGGSITLKVNKITGRLASTSTPEYLIEERTYIQPHSILHYVFKDDPQGDYPENPADDPQYLRWEEAIQTWITKKGEEDPEWNVSFEEPPTEEDDEYSIEMIPKLTVNYPTPNATISSRQITTDIEVSSPRGITKVSYMLDETYVGVITEHPFNLNYNAQGIENGSHILTIIVEDDIGNRLEHEIPFTLNAIVELPGVNWAGGSNSVRLSEFPQIYLLGLFKSDQIKQVNIYTQKQGESKNLLGSIDDFSSSVEGKMSTVWRNPSSTGIWQLVAEVELNDGGLGSGDIMNIEIK
ncbi:PBP1A family penicillin-binding protein [Patescibacteria group bacterium]|nr:PBP1A family penicillin-binding protein [Patescibacteria group bacterium]MBU1895868.1 PBP1A family penicillin-binding protein [Patescibacteria group bacterium]